MGTLSLYHLSELAKDLHTTCTVSRLFMPQQTLSSHIMGLEEHYRVKLLNRKPSPSPTYVGEYALSSAETMSCENANLMDILADVQKQKRGPVLFGVGTLRMSVSLPDILPEFSSRYPDVEIRITDMNSKWLEQLILGGDLDLAIVISGDEHPSIEEKPLMSDQVCLCAADILLRKYYGDGTEDLKQKTRNMADVKDFSRLPFCVLNNHTGQNIQGCFDETGFVPNIYTTSAYVQISTSIGLKGLATYFTTRNSILNRKGEISEDISVLPPHCKGEPLLQQISVTHHKDRYLPTYTQYFQELILKYFHKIEQIPIEELISSSSILLQ